MQNIHHKTCNFTKYKYPPWHSQEHLIFNFQSFRSCKCGMNGFWRSCANPSAKVRQLCLSAD